MTIPIPLVVGAISMVAQVAQSHSHAKHEASLAEHRAGVLHDLIDAAYHKRFDLIRSGFESILRQYADQAAHYMKQHDRYAKQHLKCTDPIRRVELQSRLREVDRELGTIRIDAKLLYAHMLHAIEQIQMPASDFASQFFKPLELTPPTITI